MMRRRRLHPDLRPDWRDPAMPALFSCYDPGTKRNYLKEIPPDKATELFAKKLRKQTGILPSWHSDPSYFWNRKETK